MSRTFRVFFTVAAVLAFAAPTSAQEAQPALDGPEDVTVTAMDAKTATVFPGPLMAGDLLTTAPRTFDASPAALAPPPSTQNTTLMIVGGAALLVGAVIGGDEGTIFMVGGGVAGLIGLYRHLK